MSSPYRQGGPYTTQQQAYIRAQQEQQQQQQQRQRQAYQPPAPQQAAVYYPSPESTSPSSNGSSPSYTQPSPTLYRPAPAFAPQAQQRRSSQYFSTSGSAKEHSWYCMYPEHQTTVCFARKADLKRHYEQVHNAASVQLMDCPQSGCHRKGDLGFGRKDKLVEHLREVHKLDIPKRANGSGR